MGYFAPILFMISWNNLLIVFHAFKILHPSLDDGGGMDPECIRRCMSFGFSENKSKSSIGQCMDSMMLILSLFSRFSPFVLYFCINWFICSLSDGNGFKTSTMRLGADAIVFSRCLSNRFYMERIVYY